MAVEFSNKKVVVDFAHEGEEIKLTGNVRIDTETRNIENISGGIYKVSTDPETQESEHIGDFNLMILTLFSMDNVKYRTTASTMLDEVMTQAMTQATSLV